jgi:hypothetical protein
VVQLLGIYPKEYKIGYNKDTHTPMFIIALFTIPKLWKQPRCPTTDEWINIYTMIYIYTMEFYSVIRINDLCFEGKCMQLEDIMLSEVSQAQKQKEHIFSLIHVNTNIMITFKPICRTFL